MQMRFEKQNHNKQSEDGDNEVKMKMLMDKFRQAEKNVE